ncbi:restriction endonuclease subunit S [Bacteroides finegoldii]|uniref:restriction endonuclease subunit S n=1 Tax=Bacteroides finegoldii TaxID=338188 RepID=UPI001E572020|nr:restriction endonuclease subunit S [Bacteroides finegoldii]
MNILDSVCTFHNGRAYKQHELLSAGKYRVLRVGNFFTNDSWYYSDLELEEDKTASDGELLYAWSASFGPRFWKGEKVIYHYHIWKIDSFQEVCKEFLFYFLEKDAASIKNEVQGGTMAHITKADMERRNITYPTICEQSKIARLLFLLDHRIATQNKIIEKYESLIKGINEKLLINKKEYTTYRLSDICEIRSGYSGTQLTGTQGLMVSRIETISKHCINLDKVGYVKPFDSSADFKLHIGDILFSNINSVQYIGNTAFVDREYDLYHGMNLLRLIPRKIVEPFYVFLLLNTAKYKIHFQSICNKAISQASINQTELGKTVIHIPDLLYQKQICQLYNSLYNKKNIENLYLQALKQQKNHLLRQMVI